MVDPTVGFAVLQATITLISLFQNSDVVHSVSDGDHAGGPELLDKRCFLASFVAGCKASCFGMKLIGDRIELPVGVRRKQLHIDMTSKRFEAVGGFTE